MGYYLDPTSISKDEWLEDFAEHINSLPEKIEADKTVLVWLDNGAFTAVNVCKEQRDLDYWKIQLPKEYRPYLLYIAKNELLTSDIVY